MVFIVDSEIITWLDKEPSKSILRNKFLKEQIEYIKNGGGSNHSAMGATLRLLLTRLERADISYQLTAHPKHGYYVQGLPREEWMDNEQ